MNHYESNYSDNLERDDDGDDVDLEECELCGDDHETRDCGMSLCGKCYQFVDNCDCDPCVEIDAAEWIALGRPTPIETEA